MANEGDYNQALYDKKVQFYGSTRWFATGLSISSGTSYVFTNFSGTSTGFGPDHNVLANKVMMCSSGGNTIPVNFMFRSGTQCAGTLQANGNAVTFDGINTSGVWFRCGSSTSAQVVYVYAW